MDLNHKITFVIHDDGEVIAQGNSYILDTDDIEAAFDGAEEEFGKLQRFYMKKRKELLESNEE